MCNQHVNTYFVIKNVKARLEAINVFSTRFISIKYGIFRRNKQIYKSPPTEKIWIRRNQTQMVSYLRPPRK